MASQKTGERDGAVSGCEKMAGAGVRERGNGVGNGSHRNRFERQAEILQLSLRSHALNEIEESLCNAANACSNLNDDSSFFQ